MKKSIAILLLAVLLVPGMLFASGANEDSATKGYVFASDCTWPPLEYIDENGEMVGFEIDLVKAISEHTGVPMTNRNTAWDAIFAGLTNGQYDGIVSGVTVTEERKASMDFTTPVLLVGQVVIVRTEDADKYAAGVESFTGERVGVQIGTTGDFVLENYNVETRRYDEIGLAVEDLINENLSGVVCDSIIASDFVLTNANYSGKLVIVGEPFTSEDIAFVVQKGNTELLDLLNGAIADLEADGTIDELKAKWNLL